MLRNGSNEEEKKILACVTSGKYLKDLKHFKINRQPVVETHEKQKPKFGQYKPNAAVSESYM
jgi:hypothetical protein